MVKGTLVLVACYPKSGGSWLTWMLIDIIFKPDYYCDQVNKPLLDKMVHKTETVLDKKPHLHMMRHPLDIACSWYNYKLLTNRANKNNFDQHIQQFYADHLKYKGFIKYGLTAPIQIRYEDLLEDPTATLVNIVGQQDVSETIEKYSLANCRNREHQVELDRPNNQKFSFFNRAEKFYFKDMMNKSQIHKGHELFGDIILKHWPESLKEI